MLAGATRLGLATYVSRQFSAQQLRFGHRFCNVCDFSLLFNHKLTKSFAASKIDPPEQFFSSPRPRGRSFSSSYPTNKKSRKSGFLLLAGATRLELATSAVTGQRSNQLNYTPVEQLVLYMIKIQIASLFLKKLHFFYFMWKIAL